MFALSDVTRLFIETAERQKNPFSSRLVSSAQGCCTQALRQTIILVEELLHNMADRKQESCSSERDVIGSRSHSGKVAQMGLEADFSKVLVPGFVETLCPGSPGSPGSPGWPGQLSSLCFLAAHLVWNQDCLNHVLLLFPPTHTRFSLPPSPTDRGPPPYCTRDYMVSSKSY